MAIEARKENEAFAIVMDSAETDTTSAPTAATEGKAVHRSKAHRKRCHLVLEKGAASGTRTLQVKVHGYLTRKHTQSAHPSEATTEVASSGVWVEVFDTGALSDTADFNVAYLLLGLSDFDRLATEVVTNGGTTPTLTSSFAFSGIERS